VWFHCETLVEIQIVWIAVSLRSKVGEIVKTKLLKKKKCRIKSFWLIKITASILHHKANLGEMKIAMTLPTGIYQKKFSQPHCGPSWESASYSVRQPFLSQTVSRSLRWSIIAQDGHCARPSIPLTHENVINRFSHDVLTAILVNQNNPRGIELHFYANNFFCFMKSIWPLVKWVKTICINGFINENWQT